MMALFMLFSGTISQSFLNDLKETKKHQKGRELPVVIESKVFRILSISQVKFNG